jgi:predicted membrane protein
MSKDNIEKKDVFENFVGESILWWVVVLTIPASIYFLTDFLDAPLWIGWNWTIAIYVFFLILYILRFHQFRKYRAALAAEKNNETPRA